MELNLTGQTAVIVGAAKGMGLAVARAFAAERAHVVLADLDPLVIESAASLAGGQVAMGFVVDVTDLSAVTDLAAKVISGYGRVDHVICAAGVGSGKYGFPFWNLQPADWRRVLDVNIMGPVHVAHAFAPLLTAARRGTLLFFSSVAAQIGSQTDPPYSAAKAAVLNFAQCAAKDLAPYNVRVNTICPGMVKTELNRSVWQAWYNVQPAAERLDYETWAEDKIRKIAPLGRWQTVEEIAALACFLASDHAVNMTGQVLNVDGGQVMHW